MGIKARGTEGYRKNRKTSMEIIILMDENDYDRTRQPFRCIFPTDFEEWRSTQT
jgi:hypothetical protein